VKNKIDGVVKLFPVMNFQLTGIDFGQKSVRNFRKIKKPKNDRVN
jgi:hypothetical protein